jgi:hypothetical protein
MATFVVAHGGAYEPDSSHNPHVTVPEALTGLLDRISRG